MRQSAGKTLPELALALNYDKGNLSRMERGLARCPAPLAAAWAEACGFHLQFVADVDAEEERLLRHLDLTDRRIIGRIASVLPRLDPIHRATLLHLIELWERAHD